MSRPKAVFILDELAFNMCFGADERHAISKAVQLVAPALNASSMLESLELLRDVEIIISGWGAPVVDVAFLEVVPKLKAVFYAGGSVAGWVTQAVWDRGIVVSSAYAANAIPVAEYTLSVILFSLKHGWRLINETRLQRRFAERNAAPGAYGSTVGLISMGATGRATLKLLKPFDLHVLVYDPYLSSAEAAEMGVEQVSLDEIFRRCDVVSLHTPLLTETEGMITGEHFSAMKHGATFINTARGAIVRHHEMAHVAMRRKDLQFVLDVTEPEPGVHETPDDSSLYEVQNVIITPHIAGSVGKECRRMGRFMIDELDRYLAGKPLYWQITPELARYTSHRPVVHIVSTTLRRPAGKALLQTGNGQSKTTDPSLI